MKTTRFNSDKGLMVRKDWWRFWYLRRSSGHVHRKSVSITIYVGGKELTLGYRFKDWNA